MERARSVLTKQRVMPLTARGAVQVAESLDREARVIPELIALTGEVKQQRTQQRDAVTAPTDWAAAAQGSGQCRLGHGRARRSVGLRRDRVSRRAPGGAWSHPRSRHLPLSACRAARRGSHACCPGSRGRAGGEDGSGGAARSWLSSARQREAVVAQSLSAGIRAGRDASALGPDSSGRSSGARNAKVLVSPSRTRRPAPEAVDLARELQWACLVGDQHGMSRCHRHFASHRTRVAAPCPRVSTSTAKLAASVWPPRRRRPGRSPRHAPAGGARARLVGSRGLRSPPGVGGQVGRREREVETEAKVALPGPVDGEPFPLEQD